MRFFRRVFAIGSYWGSLCLIAVLFLSAATAPGQQSLPKILMLSQPACPDCGVAWEVLEEIQSEYEVEIEDFNVREDMSAAKKYGAKKTPFLVFFDRERKKVATRQGKIDREAVLEIFSRENEPLKKK